MPKPENDRMISDLRRALDEYAASDENEFETAFCLALVSGPIQQHQVQSER